jgi:hypothetical protein
MHTLCYSTAVLTKFQLCMTIAGFAQPIPLDAEANDPILHPV